MNNKSIKKVLSTITAIVTVFATMTVSPAMAANKHYENYIIRTCGVNWLQSCKTVFNWNVDSNWNLTESTAYQVVNGLNVNAGGVTRTWTGDHEHDWSAITEETFGISYKGIGIGATISHDDRVSLMNSGQLWVDYD